MKKYFVIVCLLIVSGCSKTPDINGVYQGKNGLGEAIDYTFSTVDGHLKLNVKTKRFEKTVDCRFIKSSNTEIICGQDKSIWNFTVKDDETLVDQVGGIFIKKSK